MGIVPSVIEIEQSGCYVFMIEQIFERICSFNLPCIACCL